MSQQESRVIRVTLSSASERVKDFESGRSRASKDSCCEPETSERAQMILISSCNASDCLTGVEVESRTNVNMGFRTIPSLLLKDAYCCLPTY